MRTPITANQGLQLASSSVQNAKYQKLIMDWKAKNCHAYKLAMKSEFDNKRAEWCNYLNIDKMYEDIYQNLCIDGLACEHPEPVWRDENGNVV
jgi:hypothetical protein